MRRNAMFVAIHKGSVNVTFSGQSKAIVKRLLVQHGYNLNSFDIRETDEQGRVKG